jgi:predicted amino acid dehydrogenase
VIHPTADLDALRDADVIFTATSDPAPVIFARHVREGCIILDLGRPADVDASVAAVPRVEVIPGGVFRLPGDPKARLDIGYGLGLVPACLAETVILALDGAYERVSLGDRTKAEHVDFFITRGAELGFDVVTGSTRPERPIAAAVRASEAGAI